MRKRGPLGLLAVCAASLALAPAANAVTLILAPRGNVGPEPYQSWADRAKVPTVRGPVVLGLTPACPVVDPFCNSAAGRAIALDVTPSRLGDRRDLLRQLGIVYQATLSEDHPLAQMDRDLFGLVYARCALRHGHPTVPIHRPALLRACRQIGRG